MSIHTNAAERNRLLRLADAFLDDDIAPRELHELESLLVGSRRACILFTRYMQFDTSTRYGQFDAALDDCLAQLSLGAAPMKHQHAPALECEPPGNRPEMDASAGMAAANDISEKPQRQFVNEQSAPQRIVWQRGIVSLLFATASTVLVLAVLAIIRTPQNQREIVVPAEKDTPAQAAPLVGRITGLIDCEWGGNVELRRGKPLRAGQSLILKAGLAEVTFRSGAVVLLEGPASFIVEQENGVQLNRGRLVANIETKSAIGFTVKTPSATVVDLGTEFAVEVGEHQSLEVHVFQGKVNVQFREEIEAAGATQNNDASNMLLKEGEALRQPLPAQPWTPLAADADRFRRKLPPWSKASAVLAGPIRVPNYSFESPNFSLEGWNRSVPTGWTYEGNTSGIRCGSQTFAVAGYTGNAPADGNINFFMIHPTPTDPVPYLTSPVVVREIPPNTNYTLTVALGNRADFTIFDNGHGDAMNIPYRYELQLLVNDEIKASRVIGGVALPGHENFIPEHEFRDFSLSLSSAEASEIVGGKLKIRLSHGGGTYEGQTARAHQGAFDNVRLIVAPNSKRESSDDGASSQEETKREKQSRS